MEKHNLRVSLPFLFLWRSYCLLSITELSEKAGIGRDTIIHLEHQRTQANPGTIGKLSDAMGIDRRQLVYEKPPE
jgi:Helix-turn-helix